MVDRSKNVMKETCSLEDAALVIGVGPNQAIQIIDNHPDIFSLVNTRATPNISVSVSSLQAFKRLYKDAYSFIEIANRLGVSIKRIQKVKSTLVPIFGTVFLFPANLPQIRQTIDSTKFSQARCRRLY